LLTRELLRPSKLTFSIGCLSCPTESGSGTFLFHAIRHLVATGEAEGWPGRRILEACAENVRGLDVHPVAVTLARVTWLLALGGLIGDRPAKLTVPVFLGDAMQWNLRRYVKLTFWLRCLVKNASFRFRQASPAIKLCSNKDWKP
jgi:hypothetical protein